MSETDELKARPTKLEAWVETVMRILAGQSGTVENDLIHLEEATGQPFSGVLKSASLPLPTSTATLRSNSARSPSSMLQR